MSYVERVRAAVIRAIRFLLDTFRPSPVTVSVYTGWCTRGGRRAPTDCFFFQVTNTGREPVSIQKLGVRLRTGKEIFLETCPFHPPVPFELETRHRRVFSLTVNELTGQIGEQGENAEVVAALVNDASGTVCQGRVPQHIREQLRADEVAR